MKLDALRTLVKEEINRKLNEDYQDKFKMVGNLFTDIEERPQKEIYSDIRAITGVTVISSVEPLAYNEQDKNKFKEKKRILEFDKWLDRRPGIQEKLSALTSTDYSREGLKDFIFPPSGNMPKSGRGVAAKQIIKSYIANFTGLSQDKGSQDLQKFIDLMNSYAANAALGKTNLLPGQISNKELDELKSIDMSMADNPEVLQWKYLKLGSKDILDKVILQAKLEYGDKYESELTGDDELTKFLGKSRTPLTATTSNPMFQSKLVPNEPMTLMEFMSQDASDFEDPAKGQAFENASDLEKLQIWKKYAI